jgi:hypothetical protein
MTLRAGNNLLVELNQVPEKGTPWQVCVYKKMLGFKKQISCDWFLDQEQARRYAEQLAKELQSNSSTETLKLRKAGWTLHRSAR